jgi:hypothetical protein
VQPKREQTIPPKRITQPDATTRTNRQIAENSNLPEFGVSLRQRARVNFRQQMLTKCSFMYVLGSDRIRKVRAKCEGVKVPGIGHPQ